mmetsp:Transcript_43917/g.79414  ORF Transcript_43917/g.79414 Transcript_43917/m.79414 type:complete len:726 (+) Transcript_43917:79-2256(+)
MAPAVAAFQLSASQKETLAALCDTFIPSLNDAETTEVVRSHLSMAAGENKDLSTVEAETVAFCRLSASQMGVPEAVEATLRSHVPPDAAAELGLLLSAMSSRVGMLAIGGVPQTFASLDRPGREAVLDGLAKSMFAAKRKIFMTLRSLIVLKAFSGGGGMANWSLLGYAGPEPPERVAATRQAAGRTEHIFQMLNSSITADTSLDFDAVVIGSGCGGAVAAAELACAGHRVLVLEKGKYFSLSEMSGVEGEALDQLYERGGLVSTEDTGLAVLAGGTFGGGSAINWACCLRTPDYVRQEWATEHGLKRFATDEFGDALDAICKRINVTSTGISHNRNNELFIDGCQKAGYEVEDAPQNMADVSPGAPGAGFICAGDRYEIKQSMTVTFLRDAAAARVPAQFADRCKVSEVTHSKGVATGVRATIIGSDGQPHQLTIRARVVVVACGSINSPALLLRSRLPNKNGLIGKNLRLHPVSIVTAKVPAGAPDVVSWEGAPMTAVSNECARGPFGDNYGCKLECPSIHAGLGATGVAGLSKPGKHFKQEVLNLRRLTSIIVLVRDKDSGEVRLDKNGEPRLYYNLSEHDQASMLDGLEKAIRIAAASGVEAVGTTQAALGALRTLPPMSMVEARAAAVDGLVADVRRVGFPLYSVTLISAHQMGTCKMGSSAQTSVVNADGQNWEVSGLFVSDASVFPTSSGSNPMLTTLGIAHMVAQQIKRQLQPSSRL